MALHSFLPRYAELHCLSSFSFLRGASQPDELVGCAHALGYAALAITDECSAAGVVRAHLAAKQCSLNLIVGSEFALSAASPALAPASSKLVLLAADREGYGNLAELITACRRRACKGSYAFSLQDVAAGVPGCLALLAPGEQMPVAEAAILAEIFRGRLWMLLELHAGPNDRARAAEVRDCAARHGLPLAAAGDVRMHSRERRALADTLAAIRLGTRVAEAGFALAPNGERHLRRREQLARTYPPEALAQTLAVAERCSFSLDELRYEYPQELVPPGETPITHLRSLSLSGLAQRYPGGAPAKVLELVGHELSLIAELGYEPYFLTVHDLVRFARSRSILCQGRGSAANSAVCYALGITEVDPTRMNMLFERFISRERNEPPDIDVDFEHERREEVMQYVYARYGRHRAALTATLITYRPKSAVRDVGKALGFSADQIERLSGSLAWWDGRKVLAERLAGAGFDPENPGVRRLLALAGELVGFPRHLSQHTGGFVIARDRLSRLVPIENAAMENRTVIQWDKDDLDALGLLKIDVLALGMLTAIRKALEIAGCRRGTRLAMSEIPAEDPLVYRMISKGDTVGVFQIESRAQMNMLPRLRPENFYHLVIEVAIVRPGPIQGGMVHPYLRRRQGLEPVTYPSEQVKDVLERTLGVPIFQEQVMQLAVVAAGFTPGEADALRRAMAAWRRKGGLEKFEHKLTEGMRARGYTEAYAQAICRQIKGFGEYGFPESHAASFALLVYVSAWLKCHEPAAFAAALLNSQPMGFYAPAQLVQDARRHGVEVRAVDATQSGWDCTLEDGATGPALRLGLRMVKGLSQAGAERLVAARAGASFESVEDLALRAQLDRRDLDHLARSGALEPLAGHRRQAAWSVAGIERLPGLLAGARFAEATPALAAPSEGETVVADYAALGLTLGRHPLALLRPRLARMRLASAEEVRSLRHGKPARAAGIVIGRQRPDTASGVMFVTLEDETGCVNVIVWRDLQERQRRELLGARMMAVYGTIELEGEVVHLLARRLVDHTALLGRLATRSRDFH
ncbi:MAG: error-prone DNA polymerase [Betaproteobacteria bacterium]|nr:error-prone DNA polymerase [Betaproteobacteria bacterium]